MLQKPGSSNSGSGTPRTARSSNKQVIESPDDAIRKLSRLPTNRKCCDCTSKLPNSVNVTLGIFLCQVCAGIHRELPGARIKGMGHTTFTQPEVDSIALEAGNERVNAVYLANYHPSQERMKPPVDNNDSHILRNWILRKYKDKAWYLSSSPDGGSSTTGTTSTNTNTNTNTNTTASTTNTTKNNERGIAGMMRQPTVVANLPPKAAAKKTADLVVMMDLLGDTTTTTTTTTTNDSEWDAFGHSRQQQQQQQPSAAAAAAAATVVDDFANFDTAPVSSSTTTTATTALSFANFDTVPPSTTTTPLSNFPVPPVTPMIATTSPNDFGNFSSFDNITHHHQQQQQQQQQPQPNGFANFDNDPIAPVSSQLTTGPATMPPPPQPVPFDKFDAFDSCLQISSNTNTTTTINDTTASSNTTTMIQQPMMMMMPHPPTTTTSTTTTNTPAPPLNTTTKVVPHPTKFQSGQKVYYHSSSFSGPVNIIKVHFDDALEPFYTIALPPDGKEKQTDDAHLSTITEYHHPATTPHHNISDTTVTTTALLQEEITNLISHLSVTQLQQIQQFIVQHVSSSSSSTPSDTNLVSQQPPVPIPNVSQMVDVVPPLQLSSPPPENRSMPPGQEFHANHSTTTGLPISVANVSQSNPTMSPQDPPLSLDRTSGAMPQQEMAPANGSNSTGGMMMGLGSAMMMMNGPPGATVIGNNNNINDAFGGIPSPDTGGDSKPSVAQLSSLPAPPLVSSTMMMMNSTTLPPSQGYHNIPQPTTVTMNPNTLFPSAFSAPGPVTTTTTNYPIPTSGPSSMSPMNAQQQQQQQPMNPSQNTTVSTNGAPLSPLSPKGNPFDFY